MGYRSLAINSKGHIFAGALGNVGRPGDSIGLPGIYRSIDNGENWVPLNLNNVNIRAIVIDTNGNIFAGADGVWEKTGRIDTSSLFRSSDNGETWLKMDKGMNNPFVLSLVINSRKYIFAGLISKGIFRSTDDGKSWTEFNSGLIPLPSSSLSVNSLAINSNDFIFASIANGGIFRTINPTTSVEKVSEETPKLFNLYQNYPNPFNPSTVINYQLPINSFVTLKIFDILGREITSLINEKQTAGMHSITWDAKNIPAGMYFYKLQTEKYSEVKKMILIK